MLAGLFVSILPLSMQAEEGRFEAPLSTLSCFGAPDYCVKQFARTHDRESYDLCLMSQKICRARQYDWKSMRKSLREDRAILIDCFPINTVEDLLRLCKDDKNGQRETCRQKVVSYTSEALHRGKTWLEPNSSPLPVACTEAASISDGEYVNAFVDWAEKHPSERRSPLVDGLSAATAATWPCSGGPVGQGR
jgi:Rap1a immunity proteins